MEASKLIINEFRKRVFDESYPRIYKCLGMLSHEELWYSVNKQTPAIGSLILHLCGNARQWIVAGIGGKKDIRDRASEFIPHPSIRRTDLIFVLENLKLQLNDTLKKIDDKNIQQPITIQGIDETYFSVLIHVLEHFSYHTGQITTITKVLTQKPTHYYDESKLNDKLKSN
jgi:uncharacterized damage-inducible protein DinB